MDRVFEQDAFVCINIAGTPTVQEITAGNHLATIHPWTQHVALEDAIAAAKAINPEYVFTHPHAVKAARDMRLEK